MKALAIFLIVFADLGGLAMILHRILWPQTALERHQQGSGVRPEAWGHLLVSAGCTPWYERAIRVSRGSKPVELQHAQESHRSNARCATDVLRSHRARGLLPQPLIRSLTSEASMRPVIV